MCLEGVRSEATTGAVITRNPTSATVLSRIFFLQNIATNDLLYDLIFDECTAVSLVRLLRACRRLHMSVEDYISRRFSIVKLLSRYFQHPSAFRNLQAVTGTVISGSSALQFFDRSYYPKSDLDLYVPFSWRQDVG